MRKIAVTPRTKAENHAVAPARRVPSIGFRKVGLNASGIVRRAKWIRGCATALAVLASAGHVAAHDPLLHTKNTRIALVEAPAVIFVRVEQTGHWLVPTPEGLHTEWSMSGTMRLFGAGETVTFAGKACHRYVTGRDLEHTYRDRFGPGSFVCLADDRSQIWIRVVGGRSEKPGIVEHWNGDYPIAQRQPAITSGRLWDVFEGLRTWRITEAEARALLDSPEEVMWQSQPIAVASVVASYFQAKYPSVRLGEEECAVVLFTDERGTPAIQSIHRYSKRGIELVKEWGWATGRIPAGRARDVVDSGHLRFVEPPVKFDVLLPADRAVEAIQAELVRGGWTVEASIRRGALRILHTAIRADGGVAQTGRRTIVTVDPHDAKSTVGVVVTEMRRVTAPELTPWSAPVVNAAKTSLAVADLKRVLTAPTRSGR